MSDSNPTFPTRKVVNITLFGKYASDNIANGALVVEGEFSAAAEGSMPTLDLLCQKLTDTLVNTNRPAGTQFEVAFRLVEPLPPEPQQVLPL